MAKHKKRRYLAEYESPAGLNVVTVLAEGNYAAIRQAVRELGLDGLPIREARHLVTVRKTNPYSRGGRKRKLTAISIRERLRQKGYSV